MAELTEAQKQWLAALGVVMNVAAGPGEATEDSTHRSKGKVASASRKKRVQAGRRTAVFEVRWAEDSDQFYKRVLSALTQDSAFRGIPADQFNAVSSAEPQPLTRLVAAFHQSYAMRHSDGRAGQKLKLQFSADYDPDPDMYGSSLQGKTLSLVDSTAPAKPKEDRTVAPVASGAAGTLAGLAVAADREGWSGLHFIVENDGRTTLVTSMEKVGPEKPRPAGVAELSEGAAAKEVENFMAIVAEHKGQYEGHFWRDPKSGAMRFMKWAKGPDGPKVTPPPAQRPQPQLSQAEQFERETGHVYPQRINQTLHDVGAAALKEANPFSLKNLPYTIAGVLIPIGAMKLLTMDAAEFGGLIRLEWQLDETLIEEAAAARAAQGTPKAPMPTRNLKPGDIIEVPIHGQQRVVSVTPQRIVTEPVAKPDIKPIPGHSGKDVLANYPAKAHVFEGRPDGGFHSTARPNVNARQLRVLENPRNGVYKIKVEITGADGSKVVKDSTMFPDGMSEQAVMDEVYAVMLEKHKTTPLPPPNAKNEVLIEGTSPKGLNIRVVLKSDGDSQVLITFYPKR